MLTEFARVLRPGGHVVVCDIHPESVARGSIPALRGPDERPGRPGSPSALVPEAARAAGRGVPAMLVWHFRLPEM